MVKELEFINKQFKEDDLFLIIGSFTSPRGVERYYYCSKTNIFWHLLSLSLKDGKCEEYFKRINESDVCVEDFRKKFISFQDKHHFRIMDLLLDASYKNNCASALDKDIDWNNSSWNENLFSLLKQRHHIKYIFTTSLKVKEKLISGLKKRKQFDILEKFNIKIISLPSPSPAANDFKDRDKERETILEYKERKWKEAFRVVVNKKQIC